MRAKTLEKSMGKAMGYIIALRQLHLLGGMANCSDLWQVQPAGQCLLVGTIPPHDHAITVQNLLLHSYKTQHFTRQH